MTAYRAVYNLEQHRSGFGGVTASHSATGHGPVRAIDSDYFSTWNVSAGVGTFYIQFDRGASPPAYAGSFGLGLFNHNLFSAGVTEITVEEDTDAGFPSPSTIAGNPDVADDEDRIWELDSQGTLNERYWRISFVVGSGDPSEVVQIGQVMFGDYVSLGDDNLPLPVSSGLVIPSTLMSTGVGGDSASARGHRHEDASLIFEDMTATERDAVRSIVSSQEAQLRPFGLHTHRDTWETSGLGSNVEGGGKAWMARYLGDRFDMGEVQGADRFDLPSITVRRYVKVGSV